MNSPQSDNDEANARNELNGRYQKFAKFYSTFRASTQFLVGLVVLIAGWLAAHFAFGIDPTFGGINLFLSSEASISLALFAIATAIADQVLRQILRKIEIAIKKIDDQQERQDAMLEHLEQMLEYLVTSIDTFFEILEQMRRRDDDGRGSETLDGKSD